MTYYITEIIELVKFSNEINVKKIMSNVYFKLKINFSFVKTVTMACLVV